MKRFLRILNKKLPDVSIAKSVLEVYSHRAKVISTKAKNIKEKKSRCLRITQGPIRCMLTFFEF